MINSIMVTVNSRSAIILLFCSARPCALYPLTHTHHRGPTIGLPKQLWRSVVNFKLIRRGFTRGHMP